jgi:hypothetical protein
MLAIAGHDDHIAPLSWQDFVTVLSDIKSAGEHRSEFVQILPPPGCAREARRVIRDLDLSDRIELLEPAVPASDATASGARLWERSAQVLRSFSRLLRSSIVTGTRSQS